MDFEEVYISALLKWELIVDMWDYNISYKKNMKTILSIFPGLMHYSSFCSFCYFWDDPQCDGCPLVKECGYDCREIDSPYNHWFIAVNNKTNARDLAEQIRNDVKKIYLKKGGRDYKDTKELLNRYSFL